MTVVLVLNASYEVLGVTSWQRAICMVLTGYCDVLERSTDGTIRTPSGEDYHTPAVIRLKKMVKAQRGRQVPVTRQGVRARDKNMCQNAACKKHGSTLDHVIPRSKGGAHTWENLVWMCQTCNQKKADKLLSEAGMTLRKRPVAPSFEVILATRAQPEWYNWLPKPA